MKNALFVLWVSFDLLQITAPSMSLSAAELPAAGAEPAIAPKIPRFSTNYMDASVQPANDFYQYADGAWVKNNPVPPDKSRWGAFMELQERNWFLIHEILAETLATEQPVNSPARCIAMTWGLSPDSSMTSISPDLTTKKLQSQSPTLNSFSPALYFLSTVKGQLPNEASCASLSMGNATLRKSLFCMADPRLEAKLFFSPAQKGQGPWWHRQFHFINVTPGPPFARLEGGDNGVARVMEMTRGMAAG